MENGQYYVEVTLHGGTGKAMVQSPALLEVNEEGMLAEIVWSSSSYDKMLVEGKEYFPLANRDTSCFWIPISALDTDISVSAETVAMSQPHMIDYTLYFDAESLKKVGNRTVPFLLIAAAVLLAVTVIAGVLLHKRKRKKEEQSV